MAQNTKAPTGQFETAPTTHDGMTPINMAVVFSEPVVGFTDSDVFPSPYDTPLGIDQNSVAPTISTFRQDSTNALGYTFTITPISLYSFGIRILQKNQLTDEAGNQNSRILGRDIRYEDPNVRPVPDAGPDQTVTSGATVTLDGRGTTDGDGTVEGYQWVQAGTGTHPALSNGGLGAVVTFTAPTLAPGAADVTLSYALLVADNQGLPGASSDAVVITVTTPVPTDTKARIGRCYGEANHLKGAP